MTLQLNQGYSKEGLLLYLEQLEQVARAKDSEEAADLILEYEELIRSDEEGIRPAKPTQLVIVESCDAGSFLWKHRNKHAACVAFLGRSSAMRELERLIDPYQVDSIEVQANLLGLDVRYRSRWHRSTPFQRFIDIKTRCFWSFQSYQKYAGELQLSSLVENLKELGVFIRKNAKLIDQFPECGRMAYQIEQLSRKLKDIEKEYEDEER